MSRVPSVTKLIEALTSEQEAQLPVWRDRWLAHGLSTEPADREGAKAGVLAAYAAAHLKAPVIFVWLRSPLEGAVGATMLERLLKQGAPVWDQVRGQVGDQVRGQVRDQVWGQVRGQVWDQVWDQVRGQVRDQVWGQVWGQVWDQVYTSCWGQHDAGWLSWMDYFRVVVGIAAAERAAGLIRVGQCCGWWWPFKGAVILTERPTQLHRDEQHRLHSVSGPAIAYPDGWGVWSWHGVRVPREVIETPELLTAPKITNEANAEVRRVMIERFSVERYLREANASQIHADTDGLGNPRRLLRLPRKNDTPIVAVEVLNSTPEPDGSVKRYMLRVPPQIETCQAAVAWTFNAKAEEYAPVVES